MDLRELPVTLLHGGPALPWSLSPLAAALSARGALVTYPRYAHLGMGDLSRGLEQVVAALPEEPGIILGHSLGGLMALRAVAHGARPLAVVGLGAAWRGVENRSVFPSLRQARAPQPIPELPCPVVSVVSTADRVVPEWSSRLGRVIEVSGVSHGGLARATGLVLEVLRDLDPHELPR